MAQGSRTHESKRIEFAAEYLSTRCASEAARRVEIPERTGRKLAAELDEDPEFAERCRKQRARVLDIASDAAAALIPLGIKRAHECAPVQTNIGAWSDISAAYLKSVADLGRTVEKLSRLEAERAGEVAPSGEVRIVFYEGEKPPPGAEPK